MKTFSIRALGLVLLTLLGGCSSATPPPNVAKVDSLNEDGTTVDTPTASFTNQTEEAVSEPEGDAKAPDDCPSEVEGSESEAQYKEGKSLVEACAESCQKEGGDGAEKRHRGIHQLRAAVRSGHLGATSYLGRTSFTDLMTSGTDPELKDEYVEAISMLRTAALRGDEAAIASVPGVADVRVVDGQFAPGLTGPLAQLPVEWVREGITKGDLAMGCFEPDAR